MRGPHVRFCERCRGVILCTYSTQDLAPSHTRPPRPTAGNSSAGCLKTGPQYTGFPKTTIRRGEVVYDNGKIVGKAGSGRFIPGGKFNGQRFVPSATERRT